MNLLKVKKLLEIIAENSTVTQAQYAEQLGVSKRTVFQDFCRFAETRCAGAAGNQKKGEVGY